MTMAEFLFDRLGQLLLQAAFTAAAAALLWATGTGGGIILLLLIAWMICLIYWQAADFWLCRTRLRELESILQGLDRKYLFFECAPKPKGAYERRLWSLCRRAGQAMIGAVSDAQAAQREYREYVESWVHEIKSPITAAGLSCRSAAPEIRRRLSRELSEIEAHVERALYYARAENPEKDLVIRQHSLAQIAAQALGQHRLLLMGSGIRVETQGLDQTVYTDGKWAVFILGQLLQNAARYHGESPLITLSAVSLGQRVQLCVADNGIGIAPHDLPRIFDRGFTGSNGRSRGGATGMGLYLCRRLAGPLGLTLQAESTAGEGTRFTLSFPAKEKLTKS